MNRKVMPITLLLLALVLIAGLAADQLWHWAHRNGEKPMNPSPECLKKAGPSFHERVDAERWIALFPLEPEREKARAFVLARQKELPSEYKTREDVERHIRIMSPQAESVNGPRELAVMEQLRAETDLSGLGLTPLCTDLFLWNLGEPPNRAFTKVGGLPFWPKERPWPLSEEGRPMIFLAQFNFADSRDLVGELPGDILLVFLSPSVDDFSMWPEKTDDVRFFWQDAQEGTELVGPGELPETPWAFAPCWGSIHRTYDLAGGEDLDEDVFFDEVWRLVVHEGTKVGGEPWWIQDEEELPGRYVCSLGFISPDGERPWDFLNFSRPFDEIKWPETDVPLSFPMFGDGGSMYIFADDEGNVSYSLQCY